MAIGLVAVLVVLFLVLREGRRQEAELSLIAQAEERSQGTTPRRLTASGRPLAAAGYVKREGLHIDIPYLAGRRFEEIEAADLADQLGAELSRRELPRSEEHRVFEKAEIWLYDGRIFRIRKTLGHAMDIPTALGTSGFPLDLGRPIESTSEVRWNGTWSQRRIRLIKNEKDGRLYDTIDVSKFMPREML